jgi:hypothetical protein
MRQILRNTSDLSEIGPPFENSESQAVGGNKVFGGGWTGEG